MEAARRMLLLALVSVTAQAANVPLPPPTAWGPPSGAPAAPGDAFGVVCTGSTAADAPVIAEWDDTVLSDESFTLAGIRFTRRSGERAGSDCVVWLWADTPAGGELHSCRVWHVEDSLVTATVPADLPFGMYLIWVENEAGASTPVCLNRPRPTWIGPIDASAAPGTTKRVFGFNLAHDRGKTLSHVYCRPAAGGALTALPVTAVEPYAVAFTAPAQTGSYKVYCHAGHGGSFGWSDPLDLTVAAPWIRGTSSVTVQPSGGNDFTAIQNAIDAMAGQANGGTVRLVAGTYHVRPASTWDGFQLKNGVCLSGAGKSTTVVRLEWPGGSEETAISTGDNSQIEALTLRIGSLSSNGRIMRTWGHYTRLVDLRVDGDAGLAAWSGNLISDCDGIYDCAPGPRIAPLNRVDVFGMPLASDANQGQIAIANLGGVANAWRVAGVSAPWIQATVEAGNPLGPQDAGGILHVAIDPSGLPEGVTWGEVTVASSPANRSVLTDQMSEGTALSDIGYGKEIGMRFRTDCAGRITRIRFCREYRDGQDGNSHTGRLWSGSGTVLRSVVFAAMSNQGWQEAVLAEPLAVSAGVDYVVSVDGYWWETVAYNGHTAPIVNGHITGLSTVYGALGSCPTAVNPHLRFRDVVFEPDGVEETRIVGVKALGGNHPPVAVDDAAACRSGGSVLIDVLANDSDPDGGLLTLNAVVAPDHGSAAIEAGRVVRYAAPAGYLGSARFTYTVRDPTGRGASAAVTVAVADGAYGLWYEYYEGDWNLLPDFAVLTPVETGIVAGFDLSVRNRDDRFAIRFRGLLAVPATGRYSFFTTSDDGSRLAIGGATVANNDGLHAMTERSGQIDLAAGPHPIVVTFFDKTGDQGLELRWEGPGIAKEPIPVLALLRPLRTVGAAVSRTTVDVRMDGDPASDRPIPTRFDGLCPYRQHWLESSRAPLPRRSERASGQAERSRRKPQ